MTTAKLFTHGGSQAVRLPKEFRFKGTEVHVRKVGDDVVLSAMPTGSAQALVDALESFDHEMPISREQPDEQERASLTPAR